MAAVPAAARARAPARRASRRTGAGRALPDGGLREWAAVSRTPAPVDPNASFPALEEQVLERWRERDVFARVAAPPRGRRAVGLLRGPADRQRPPGLPPRPRPRLQGHLPALPDDARATASRARAAGTATACRSSSRSRRSSASPRRRRSRRYGIAEFNQRCRESVFAYVEDWNRADRADRLLDRPRRRLPHARQRLHRVGLVGAAGRSGTRTCSTRATRSSRTARAAAPRCPATRSRSATRTSSTRRSTCASRSLEPRGPLQAGDELLVWTTTPWTLVSNAAVAVDPELDLRARARRRRARARRSPRRCVERVLGEERRDPRPLPGRASSRARATSRRSPFLAGRGLRADAATPSSPPTSSPPRTAPASCTPRSPSARTTSGSAQRARA